MPNWHSSRSTTSSTSGRASSTCSRPRGAPGWVSTGSAGRVATRDRRSDLEEDSHGDSNSPGLVSGAVSGQTWQWSSDGRTVIAGAGGLLFFGPLLMILFRLKYPRWWFDWNLELQRFSTRVGIYLALMEDAYPSTDEHQSVHLDYQYPQAPGELNRFLPLVKWFLAIPHYIVLVFLYIGGIFAVIVA